MTPWLLIGLFVAASVAMWVRRRSWALVLKGPPLVAAIGTVSGLVALAFALIAGTPLVEAVTDHAVQWSMYPIVRGSAQAFVMMALLVGVSALVTELVVRGCIVDWLIEGMGPLRLGPTAAIAIGALVDALIVDGGVATRAGAGLVGIATGWMFVASARNAVPGICARLAFSIGALALEAARVIG